MTRVALLIAMLLLSATVVLSVTTSATFTQNGVVIYSPPYPYYTYTSGQQVVLNLTAKGYPNALVTIIVYNPNDQVVYQNAFQTDSHGNFYQVLFVVPNATQLATEEGFINGTYKIMVIIGTSTGVSIPIQITLIPPKPQQTFSLTVNVRSPIPYFINGTRYSYNVSQTFAAPVNISFPTNYTVTKGLVVLKVTGVNVNGTIRQSDYVFLSVPGSYSVSPVTETLYNVSFQHTLKVNINGENATGSWFWVTPGSTIVIYPQSLIISPGVAFFVQGETITVTEPGTVQLKGYTAFVLSFSRPVNVTVNGKSEVVSMLFVKPGTTVSVNPYIYNSSQRIPVILLNHNTTFVIIRPVNISVIYGQPQYLVTVTYGGVAHTAWVSKGSSPPSVIQINNYTRLVLTQNVSVIGPMDATSYYQLQYAVVINGNTTWAPAGSVIYLPEGNNPVIAFFMPTYYDGNYTGLGNAYLAVYGPVFETSHTSVDIPHVLLLALAVIIVVLLILLLRKRNTYAQVAQPLATPQPPEPQAPPAPAVPPQPPAPPPTSIQTAPPGLQASLLSSGYITTEGKAVLEMSVNRPAFLTSAVIRVTGQRANIQPISLNPGVNRVELEFGPLGQTIGNVVEVLIKLVDKETKDVIDLVAPLQLILPTRRVDQAQTFSLQPVQETRQVVQPIRLSVMPLAEGTLTQQGIATLNLQANKDAVLVSAVLVSYGAVAINTPVKLTKGNNVVTLHFGPFPGFIKYMKYDVVLKVQDPETNEVQDITVKVIGS